MEHHQDLEASRPGEWGRLEDTDPHVIEGLAARRRLCQNPWRRLVVLGDTSGIRPDVVTPGYRRTAWPVRLATELRRGDRQLALRNLSRRGVRSSRVRVQQMPAALEFRPDLAALACGSTDVVDPGFDVDLFEGEIVRMVMGLRQFGADVVLVSPFAVGRSGERPELADALRRRARLLARCTAMVAGRFGAMHVDLTQHPAVQEHQRQPALVATEPGQLSSRLHAVLAAQMLCALAAHSYRSAPRKAV